MPTPFAPLAPRDGRGSTSAGCSCPRQLSVALLPTLPPLQVAASAAMAHAATPEAVGLLEAAQAPEESARPGSGGPRGPYRGVVAAAAAAAALWAGAAGAWHLGAPRRGPTAAQTTAPGAEAPALQGLNARGEPFQCYDGAVNLPPGGSDGTFFRCLGGACIEAIFKCDGRPNCRDASDERACSPGAAPAPGPPQAPPPAASYGGGGCSERGGYSYALDWKAQGERFFEEWNYLRNEVNSGGAEYVDGQTAYNEGLTAAYPNYAIIRPGGKGYAPLKRKSVKIETKRKWQYFLMVIKYESLPWGCGIWPAVWTHSPDAPWPLGGELDMLEYCNEQTTRTSLHVGGSNRCQLDASLLNRPGCPRMPDAEFNFTGNYDCVTSYPTKIGCAPNDVNLMMTGEQMSNSPGVFAAEWTPNYLKVFRIPSSEMPYDLATDAPRPDGWDRWLLAYYPFAQSERNIPGSCPYPAGILKAQQIVIQIGFCGDWAAKIWGGSKCANRGQPSYGPWDAKGPRIDAECVAVDPHDPRGEQPAGPRDCCTRFISDDDGKYGAQQYLAEHGFFKIEWLKVFKAQR